MNSELFDKGIATRRQVLGNTYVDAALSNADEFSGDMQELVTEYCWGNVWGRSGLTHPQRSLINLSMLVALNRSHELATHVRGAINNGVTRDEIKEVLLQTAIYCGVPAALEGFRVAKDVFATIDGETATKLT